MSDQTDDFKAFITRVKALMTEYGVAGYASFCNEEDGSIISRLPPWLPIGVGHDAERIDRREGVLAASSFAVRNTGRPHDLKQLRVYVRFMRDSFIQNAEAMVKLEHCLEDHAPNPGTHRVYTFELSTPDHFCQAFGRPARVEQVADIDIMDYARKGKKED